VNLPEPPDLQLALFSFFNPLSLQDEIIEICDSADIVVSLGGVNLDVLAEAIPDKKPAIAIIGPRDERHVPQPFRPLHASGFSFRGWRIAGFSGAPAGPRNVPGNYVSEAEAEKLLSSLPPCDILLSHAPPATILQESETRPEQGFTALDEYLVAKQPRYHFYAHPQETVLEEIMEDPDPNSDEEPLTAIFVVGVAGIFEPPALYYF
jgi:Icc-related predicted phosphoesterase